ncbi:MAG: RNA polymerase factor sigma-54 [Saprospiraceae bacterium]
MKSHLSQQTTLRQGQNLLPSQIQLLQMIKLNHQELLDLVQEEAYSNPLLEAVMDDKIDSKLKSKENEIQSSYSNQDENDLPSQILYRKEENQRSIADDERSYQYQINSLTEQTDFRSAVKDQLKVLFLSPLELEVAEFIVESLDEDGYLRRRIDDIADDFSYSQGKLIDEDTVKFVLEQIQTLEPRGIAARNIKECITLQLEALPHTTHHASLALILVDEYFDVLAKGDVKGLKLKLSVTDEELQGAMDLIRHQNPFPVQKYDAKETNESIIAPEFLVERDAQGNFIVQSRSSSIQLRLNEDELKNSSYTSHTQKGKKTIDRFLLERLNSAKEFMSNIQARFKTMTDIMAAIVKRQKTYFETGDDSFLVPMTLKDIAEDTGYDVSSISRATSSKYAMTEYGVIGLKDLFNHAIMSQDGQSVTQNDIKVKIQDIISKEDPKNPLSDQDITQLLKNDGFNLVRRTIAKYRSELQIPNQQLRKKFN